MNSLEIKLFAGYYVAEHDNLTTDEKVKLIDWVKNANTEQIKYLLLTGKVKDNLVQEDLDYLKEGIGTQAWQAFGMSSGDPVKGIYTMGMSHGFKLGMAGTALAALAAMMAAKAYKSFLSKAAKACKGKSGVTKKACMEKFRLEGMKSKVRILQKSLSMCTKTKNPAACKSKIQMKIAREKAKLGQL